MERYRNVLKEIVKFAKREYIEKKPNTIKLLRIKDIRVLTLGIYSLLLEMDWQMML